MNRRTFLAGGVAVAALGGLTAFSFARMGTLQEYAAVTAAARAPLGQNPDPRSLVRYATLAANGHNTQPWRFRISEQSIEISPDFSRRTPVVDPDDHHLYASLGCAAENLSLAAGAAGKHGDPVFDAAGKLVVRMEPGPARSSVLFDAISARQSTRADFDGRPIAPADLAQLAAAAKLPGVETVIITDPERRRRIRELVIAGNTAQMADPAFVAELKQWIRFNPRAAIESGDGILSAASGNPTLPTWLGVPMFDLVFQTDAENKKYASQLDTSACIAVLVAEQDAPQYWVRAGRVCQRLALQATALGLKCSFVNQPVEVAKFRPDLAALIGAPGRRPNIVMRFGYGPDLPKSPRRPVEAVLA